MKKKVWGTSDTTLVPVILILDLKMKISKPVQEMELDMNGDWFENPISSGHKLNFCEYEFF